MTMNKVLLSLIAIFCLSCTNKTVQKDHKIFELNFNDGFNKQIEVHNASLLGKDKNKACYFDGYDDYLKLNIPYLNTDSAFSVSMWVAPFSYHIASAWMSKANTCNSKSQWRFGFGWPAAQALNVTLYKDKWDDLLTQYKLPLHQWSHLVYTLSPTHKTLQLYVNGVKHGDWTFSQYSASNDPVYIGLQQDDYYFFHGMVDEISFYNEIISDSTIAALHQEFKTKPKVKIDVPDTNLEKDRIYTYHLPMQLNDGIQTASIDTTQANMKTLGEGMRQIFNKQVDNVTSLLIYKDDKLILEEYFNNHNKDALTRVASVTKSFTATLTGIAIDQGYIKNDGQKISDFFPEFTFDNACIKEITVAHLLNHKSGLDVNSIPKDSIVKYGWPVALLKSQNHCNLGVFQYGELNPDLMQYILYKQTGQLPVNFANEYLFQPLGISDFEWRKSHHTNVLAGGTDLALRSRDLLKLGILHLNKGRFNGKQILSEDWVNTIFYDYPEGEWYHHFWKVGNDFINNEHTPFVSAVGFGGQYIRIYPKLQMVCVITAAPGGEGKDPLDLLINDIIPAIE